MTPSSLSGGRLTPRKKRIVVDTSVLVSGLVFGGMPGKALSKTFGEAAIFVSPALLREYREVPGALYRQGKINSEQLKALIAGIATFVTRAKTVEPEIRLSVCRDPADNMLL